MREFLEPKELELDGKVFILSKFPSIAGREIMAKYPLSGMPKLGDYKVNEETMLKLMEFVQVKLDSGNLALKTRELVDNHTKGWEVLAKIEWSMIEYNCSFFQDGRISTFFDDFAQKLPALISKILTGCSELLSRKEKQASTS
jgi:hypothetical protein